MMVGEMGCTDSRRDQSGILRSFPASPLRPTSRAAKRMPRAARWNVRKGASDRRMELSIPWTVAGPVAAKQPARRSQGLTSDDPDLVGRAREGDQVAFARLFEHYHAPILNYLHRMVGDRAMAEDLTQDTFIKAYNALPSTRPDLAFKPWLYRIATNTAISQLRRRKIVQWIPFMPGHDHASEQSIERSVSRRQDIEQTLSRLPQHYAAALLLREGYDVMGVFMRLGSEWEGFAAIPDEFIDAGDTVVVLGKYSGKYKKTGKSFQANFAHVWKMQDGKAAQFIQHVDTLLVDRALRT